MAHTVVLLSTYNGQKYLQEQLNSIWAQTYEGRITVLIRDDGSRDDTVSIVESYPCTQQRQIQLIRAENIGVRRSFLELIHEAAPADYYFFADQDDVWDPDKISAAVEAMADQQGPVAWCSNYRLTDMALKPYRQALEAAPQFTPLQILFYNQIPGCVMGFNRALMVLVQKLQVENAMMHDSLVLAFAAACGQVLYDPNPRISHRIHGENVVGDGHKKIVLHKWIPEKLKLLFGKEDYDMSQIAGQYLEVAGAQIHPKFRDDLELLRDFKRSRKNTRKLLQHPDTQGSLRNRTVLSIRCKIFFHIF